MIVSNIDDQHPLYYFESPVRQKWWMVVRNLTVVTVAGVMRCWKFVIVLFVNQIISAVIDFNRQWWRSCSRVHASAMNSVYCAVNKLFC